MSGGTRFWAAGRTRKARTGTRVLEAIRRAREAVPGYGAGAPVAPPAVEELARRAGLRIHTSRMAMDAPAVLLPPFGGAYRLVLAPGLGPALRRYITLHEIGHVLAGDVDEPTVLRSRSRTPQAEDVADGFALLGFLSDAELAQEPVRLEGLILRRVPLDDVAWREERIPRLARLVGRWRARLDQEP